MLFLSFLVHMLAGGMGTMVTKDLGKDTETFSLSPTLLFLLIFGVFVYLNLPSKGAGLSQIFINASLAFAGGCQKAILRGIIEGNSHWWGGKGER